MGEFKRYPGSDTRQIIDYNRFIDLTGEKLFICLDKGIMEICRYFLNSRAKWKSTYATEYGDGGYTTPTNEQMDVILSAIAEANVDMSNCEDIVTSLNEIAQNIAGISGSGCGCIADGGMLADDVNDNPTEDIPTPSDPVPPGFADRAEYDAYRCDAANWLFDKYTQTLLNWSSLFGLIGGLTLAVITGLLLLTVPPVGLVLIVGALGTLAGINTGLLFELNDIAARMEEDRDTTVCALYNASTTEGAATVLRNAAQAAMDFTNPSPRATFDVVTNNLISNQQCEVLFTKTATIDGYGGDTDCDTCSEFGDLVFIAPYGTCTGTYVSGSFSGTFVARSCNSLAFGTQRANILIQSTVPLGAVRFTSPSLAEGPDRTFVLEYSDPDNNPQSVNLTQISDFPDPLDCIAFHLTTGTPSDTDSFDLQITVAEIP